MVNFFGERIFASVLLIHVYRYLFCKLSDKSIGLNFLRIISAILIILQVASLSYPINKSKFEESNKQKNE